MKKIPKIILDEAERQGLDRMAAYLCDIDGRKYTAWAWRARSVGFLALLMPPCWFH